MLAAFAGATASIASASHADSSGITRYLVRAGELPGFTLSAPRVKRSLKAWLAGEPAGERLEDAKLYRADGFRRGAFENFSGPKRAQGVSNVVVFATSAGARRDQRTLLHPVGGGRLFPVRAIPHARGFTQGGRGHGSAADVIWVQGRCTMIVGEFRPRARVFTRSLIAAAKAVHDRTHGRCP